jgi:hypothetical protein
MPTKRLRETREERQESSDLVLGLETFTSKARRIP